MNPNKNILESKHFSLKLLAEGVYACIHKPGGAAFSNAGIIDLGNRTILVDAFDTMAAGRDLRQIAEVLFKRSVDTVILTHAHSDHWMGTSIFDETTVVLASKITRQVSLEWGKEIVEGFKDPTEWEEWVKEMEIQVQAEKDERVRIGLENSIIHTRYVMAEMADFQPRYADQTYKDKVRFQSDKRSAELLSLGRGHSEDDAVLFLPQEKIAFIGDVGFFATQPFLGFCDIDLYRKQMLFFQDADYGVLIPGHGPVGGKHDIALQLKYLDVMENLVGNVAQRGGSFEEAMQVALPEPFCKWQIGGMGRFESNVRYLFNHYGGEVPEEE